MFPKMCYIQYIKQFIFLLYFFALRNSWAQIFVKTKQWHLNKIKLRFQGHVATDKWSKKLIFYKTPSHAADVMLKDLS